jgi:hypothetical protein
MLNYEWPNLGAEDVGVIGGGCPPSSGRGL